MSTPWRVNLSFPAENAHNGQSCLALFSPQGGNINAQDSLSWTQGLEPMCVSSFKRSLEIPCHLGFSGGHHLFSTSPLKTPALQLTQTSRVLSWLLGIRPGARDPAEELLVPSFPVWRFSGSSNWPKHKPLGLCAGCTDNQGTRNLAVGSSLSKPQGLLKEETPSLGT